MKRIVWLALVILIGFGLWQWFSLPQPGKEPASEPKLVVYFCRKIGNASQVIKVYRQPLHLGNGVEARLANAMQSLLKGPTPAERQQGYYSEIPQSVQLVAVKRLNRGFAVNLNGAFAEGGGTDSMTQRLDQVVQTATTAAASEPVYLWMDGKPLTVLGGEGVEIPQPLKRQTDPS